MLLRTIIESDTTQKTIDKLITQHPRLEDVYEALKWRLSRRPESGTLVKIVKNPYWVIKSSNDFEIDDIPMLKILYSFDDKEVEIHAISE